MLVAGWLVVMRLNHSMKRWDGGLQNVVTMGSKWTDCNATLQAFLETEREVLREKDGPLDVERDKKLRMAQDRAVHLFSLLHAVASNLATHFRRE